MLEMTTVGSQAFGEVCNRLVDVFSTFNSTLDFHNVLHLTTLFSASLVFLLKAILLQSLVAFLYVNHSLSFLLPCPSFSHLNSPQSLSSCLDRKSLKYLSSTLIIFLL